MAFNGSEGEYVTLTEASAMTASYRQANPNGVKGHFFGKNKLQAMLNARGCVGLRFYNGIDAQGAEVLVVSSVNSNENDMLGTGYNILERSTPCPPCCGKGNDLNS